MIKIMEYGQVSADEIFDRGTAAADVSGIVGEILANVKENGEYLYEKLEEFAKENACVKEHRGFGFMQGLEFTMPVKDIAAKALENGLILISAGANTIRFLPPLVMQKAQIDEMLEILKKCI